MKRITVSVLILAMFVSALTVFSGCNNNGSALKLSFEDGESGKIVKISVDNNEWTTVNGAFGVRLGFNEVANVSDIEYVGYEEVNKSGDVYIARARLAASDGSEYSVEDTYVMRKASLEVTRVFEVTKEGDAMGFMTYYPLRNNVIAEAEAREWFSPSNYYGKSEVTFTGTGVKSGFYEEATVCTDMVSTPLVMNYYDGYAFSITDKTMGLRETVVDDATAEYNVIYYSEAFNLPGIGLKNVEIDGGTTVEMYHAYPCNLHNYINIRPFTNSYRMLPMRDGLKRETAFVIDFEKGTTFDTAANDRWRESYDMYEVVDMRYDTGRVFEACAEYVDDSFAVISGIPQYMTNTDHFYPESGFLYRNADLGYMMMEAGYILGNREMTERGIQVIDSQVKNDFIDDNVTFDFDRSIAEGLESTLEAYAFLKEKGIEKTDWLVYLLSKVEECRQRESWIYIPFLLRAEDVFKTDEYYDFAMERVKKYEQEHNRYEFRDAVVNFDGTSMVEREAAIIFMKVYLKLYEYSGDEKYLNLAKKAAFVCETYTIIQPISLEVSGGTGYEYDAEINRFREYAGLGNSQVMPYGLSYITGQTCNADIYMILAQNDFRKLATYTGDSHYGDFSDFLIHNCLLTVNMGDKNYIMDDIRHDSGKGFVNEYIGIAASTDSVAPARGTAHISNLAWNEYVLLYGLLDEYRRNGNEFVDSVPFNTATNKYVESSGCQNGAYRAYNAIDNDPETCWIPSEPSEAFLTINLCEFVKVERIGIKSENVEGFGLYYSCDNETFEKVNGNFAGSTDVGFLAKYVKLTLNGATENAKVFDVEIIGMPVVGADIASVAEITTKNNKTELGNITDGAYATKWKSGGKEAVLEFDLKEVRDIVETSVMFNYDIVFIGSDFINVPVLYNYTYSIEISTDGTEWTTFAENTGYDKQKAVFVDKKYARARYVRLSAVTDNSELAITDFKIRVVQ